MGSIDSIDKTFLSKASNRNLIISISATLKQYLENYASNLLLYFITKCVSTPRLINRSPSTLSMKAHASVGQPNS